MESATGELPHYDADAARAVYDETLGKLDSQLEGVSALVVAPSGQLLSIPFSVLLTGPADPDRLTEAPWLVRRESIAHVPTAKNFAALRRIAGTSRATHPWFGFGGEFVPATLEQASRTFLGVECANSAELFASLPPIPYSLRELDAARELLGASERDQLLGQAFTVDAVHRASLIDYHVLHFSTHALLPSELHCENEAAIVTSAEPDAPDANGMLLTASEIMELKLDADLVILSASNSGGPEGQVAEKFVRFGFRFMPRLLDNSNHWSVNDQAAAYLAADTLRRLQGGEGAGAAGALRYTQLGILGRAGKDLPANLAHPFFWGALALIGDGTAQMPRM